MRIRNRKRTPISRLRAGCILWGSVVGMALSLHAQENPSFTLDQAILQAISHNPELRAARYQIAIAQANLRWAGRLDDPEFEIGANTDRWGLRDGESVLEVGLAQKFPLTGRLKRERDVSEADLALAKAEVRVAEWNLATEVREAGIQVLALQKRLRLHDDLRIVLLDLVEVIEDSLQRAEASQLDLTEAKLELQTQIAAMRNLEAELAEPLGQLRGLLGLSPDTHFTLTGPLSEPTGPLKAGPTPQLIAQRPDLQLSLLREERAQANIELARSRRWQDVAVKLFLERETAQDAPTGLERNTFVGLSLSLPLPLWTPKDRLTDAPERELEAAQASSNALAVRIAHEIASALDEVEKHRLVWEQAAGENLELADKNVREVREAWQDGRASILRLQRAQERALTLRESAIESLLHYNRALTRLRRATAQDLPTAPPED